MTTRQFNIFVEGMDDHDLLLALVQQLKPVQLHPTKASSRKDGEATTYLQLLPGGDTILIHSTGGWSKLGKKQAFFIREACDFGGRTLVVFDADYNTPEHEEGGYAQRRAALLNKVAPYDSAPEVYLFPEPNQDGDLEKLLLRLVTPRHQCVMDCYDGYETCLKQYPNETGDGPYYNAPSDKRRLYDYVNVMPLTGDEWKRHHKGGGQKIFENTDLWNLNASAIQPLRDFLTQQLP